MRRFVGSTGVGLLLLLGGLESSYGFEEVKEWKQVWQRPSPSTPPYQDANGDLWIVSGDSLYHMVGEAIEKRDDIIPFVNELRELVVVGPSKGWAITTNRILEYDGVFWNVVPAIAGAGSNPGYPLISVVNENEVWFGNGYRYIDGHYEKFSDTSFRSIEMWDSQNGVAIRDSGLLAAYSNGKWIDTNFYGVQVAEDSSGNIWFTSPKAIGRFSRVNRVKRVSLPGGPPDIIEVGAYDDGEIQLDPEGDVWRISPEGPRAWADPIWRINHSTLEVEAVSGPINYSNHSGVALLPLKFIFAASSSTLWVWTSDGSDALFTSPFVFPSLTPIQDLHLDAVPASELPEVNTQTRRELFIKNTGDGTLKISNMSISSGMFRFQAEQFTRRDRTEFDVTLNKGRIPSGDSLRVVVVYYPTEAGQHNGRLVIESNDRTNPTYTINLSGATLGSVGPRIVVTSSLQFDSTFADQAQRSTLRIRNSGRGYLAVSSISSNNPAFTVSGDTLLIPPLTSRSVEVVFAPAVGGENSGQLTILSDDPVSPEVKVALIGTGVVVPEGPISLDSYLAAGDQGRRVVGNAVPGKVYTFQLNVADAPEIQGWSATIEYDPTQVRYVKDSFQGSRFIPGLVTLVDENAGGISIGGTVLGSDARKSGDGALGTLSFEVQEGFRDSTYLVIREVSFHRTDGVDDKRAVWSVATITWEPVAGPLRGDFDGDDAVSFDDFFLFADGFGSADPLLDLNGSGTVDFDDFFLFADNFGTEARAKLMVLAQQYLGLPKAPRLEGNYPNPFNSSTLIQYYLGKSGLVELQVFSLTGQRVTSLVKTQQEAGAYRVSWDGRDEQGMEVSTGAYLARLQMDGVGQVRKLMLVK